MKNMNKLFDVNEKHKGVFYVQEKNKEIDSNVLRLVNQLKEIEANVNFQKLDISISSILSSDFIEHQCMFINPLLSFLSIYDEKLNISIKSLPLWKRQLLNEKSLRNFSKEFLFEIDNFMNCFGLLAHKKNSINNIKNKNLLYKLAEYDEMKNHESSFWHTTKLKIKNNQITDELLTEIVSHDNSELTIASILSLILSQSNASEQYKDYALTWISDKKIKILNELNSDADLSKYIQILNAINLVYLRSKKIDSIEENLINVEKLTVLIKNNNLKNHILGNMFYHYSVINRIDNNILYEEEFLLKAASFDTDFYDYYYRLAIINHDRGLSVARKFYELALNYSPAPYSIINDYGFFLSESYQEEKVSSLERIVERLDLANCEKENYAN